MELYIHIPFCVKKCAYCDFASFDNSIDLVDSYINALVEDLYIQAKTCEEEIETIFIGGGTPSAIDAKYIKLIMNNVVQHYSLKDDCEITIEMNPCTVTTEKLKTYLECGINRVSMGVQSFNDATLRTLGRVHDSITAKKAIELVKTAGFKNLSIDLISCVPGETIEEFIESLMYATSLNLNHISVYQLIIEEGTRFYERYGNACHELFDEDYEANLYELTVNHLKKYGYNQYEISNFSKPGYEAKHNLGYWRQRSYLGAGLAATGSVYKFGANASGVRYKKAENFNDYINKPNYNSYESLSFDELKEEFIMLGLRTSEGVIFENYYEKFNECFPEALIEKCLMLGEKYVIINEIGFKLTVDGMLISNYIINELIELL